MRYNEDEFPGMEITSSDGDLVRQYLEKKKLADENRQMAGVSHGAATIGAAFGGIKPDESFYKDLRESADDPLKDFQSQQKLRMENARFQREGQAFERDQRKSAKEDELSDPNSAPSRVFQKALATAAPGMFSSEDLAHVSAADKGTVTSLATLKEQIAARKQQAKLAADAKKDANRFKLAPEEQAVANTLATKNGNKISIANQIEENLRDWDGLPDDQKLARGRQMLKILNSSEGQDAVGAEESKRLGEKLQFAMGNLFNDNPVRIGRDLEGFKEQAEGTMNALRSSVDANTGQIEQITGRKSHVPKQAKAPAAKPPPKVGFVKNGYMFKGGDPNKQESWVEVPNE